MSTTSLPAYKKPPHQRDDSGELDVFEAARYFSDYNDNNALVGGEEMVVKDGRQQGYFRQGRASLDLPSLKQKHQHYYKQYHQNYTISQQLQQQPLQQTQQHREEKKKHKQPSSPGGKIAYFLNSIFNQTIITSKKKKQSKSTQSMKDEDESPSGRRKRRSSMSHFRSTNNVVVDAKSLDDSSNLGFRTPPSYTMSSSTKPYQNAKSFVDYKQVLATLSKYKIHENGNNNANLKDDKIKFNKNNGIVEKTKNYANNVNHGDYQEKKRPETKKFNDEEVDDGAESDESSDLFELKIDYDFEFCSSGLPVYETTHLDNIKRPPTTITSTNGPTKH